MSPSTGGFIGEYFAPSSRRSFGSSSVFSCSFHHPPPSAYTIQPKPHGLFTRSVISGPGAEKIMSRFGRRSPRGGGSAGGKDHTARVVLTAQSVLAPKGPPAPIQLRAGVLATLWPVLLGGPRTPHRELRTCTQPSLLARLHPWVKVDQEAAGMGLRSSSAATLLSNGCGDESQLFLFSFAEGCPRKHDFLFK